MAMGGVKARSGAVKTILLLCAMTFMLAGCQTVRQQYVGTGAVVGGATGAIIGGADDTAQAKMEALAASGVHVAQSPADIGATMATALGIGEPRSTRATALRT